MPRVDPETAAKVSNILAYCRTRGLDPVQELDRIGLLCYPARVKEIKRQVLDVLADALEGASPTAWGPVPRTALDMKRLIVEYIRDLEGKQHG